MKSSGDSISITGFAESNKKVSNLMRNLEASPRLESPNLSKVKSGEKDKSTNEFDLTVQRQKPEAEKDS